MNIFDYKINEIDEIIDMVSIVHLDECHVTESELLDKYNIVNMYFAGATLCIDIKDPILNEIDVIVISYNRETYGFFSGGCRRLLSLKSLRKLEKIMKQNDIWFQKKSMLL